MRTKWVMSHWDKYVHLIKVQNNTNYFLQRCLSYWAPILESYVVNSSHALQVKTNEYCNKYNLIHVRLKFVKLSNLCPLRGKLYLCRVWQTPAWSHQISSGKTDWRHRDSGCDVSAASYHHLNHPSSSGRKKKEK